MTLLNDSLLSLALDVYLFSMTLSEGIDGFVISSMPYTSPVISVVRKYVFIENFKLYVCPITQVFTDSCIFNSHFPKIRRYHCVKCVRIPRFPCPHFCTFWRNIEIYRVHIRIQSECGKVRTRKSANEETFYTVHMNKHVCRVHTWVLYICINISIKYVMIKSIKFIFLNHYSIMT